MPRTPMPRNPEPQAWPRGGDARATLILAERLDEEAAARGLDATPLHTAIARAAIAAIGSHSPYLAQLARRELPALLALLQAGPAPVVAAAFDALAAEAQPASPRATVMAALRRARRVVALATALGDLGGAWTLEQVTATLSELAGRALELATAHVARTHGLAGARAPGGIAVLAMGKLGAGELNYSSDVDLFLLHDRPDAESDTLARFARDLAAVMETRDADGYVFRVDLRLRPDPGATPAVVSLPAARAYYERTALTWERAAMSKARPIAGDLALGQRFLDAIKPFVWRRHLDFAAIADMRGMKRRIDRSRGAGDGLLGRDLKLGFGGIREIEFTAVTLQLVWGGRDPSLREPGTVAALEALAAAGHLDRADAAALTAAYRLLRTAEHRLQMVADRQTHRLPADPAGFERFAQFMGHADAASLAAALAAAADRVHAVFDATLRDPGFAAAPAIPTDAASLAALGFRRPADASRLIAAWTATPGRALRHERTQRLLPVLLATLLPAIGRVRDPDAALARFDRLLERLPSGVQVFSLLARDPPLLERMALLLGASPVLADHLAAVPAALEGLLAQAEVTPRPLASLRRELAGRPGAETIEVAIDTARRFVRGEEFRLALAELEGRIDVDQAGRARTGLADATITLLLARVRAEHEQRFGRIAGGGAAIVALGKCGSREMVAGSDLDLMLIYDHDPGHDGEALVSSGGARALPPPTYFARLTQGLIAALTAPGAEGALYAVDMRLRPSGRAGPVAVSLAAFCTYHRAKAGAESAWTWERMALTRARVVAGPATLRRTVEAAIQTALDGAKPRAEVAVDATAMRNRLAEEHRATGPWDVKWRPGGLIEVEFIAEALQLGAHVPHAARTPSIARSFGRLARVGLLSVADARRLAEADRFWRRLQSLLRLLEGHRAPDVAALEQAMGMEGLERRMEEEARVVCDAFGRLLGSAAKKKARGAAPGPP